MRILVGDVGGTHTRLALYDGAGTQVAREVTQNANHPALWPIIQGFLRTHRARPEVACLGVAAPVYGGRVRMTNLSWTLDAAELSDRLGAPLDLINDLHAQALAITRLRAGDYFGLDDQAPRPGAPWVVLGAGTGLGTATLIPPPGASASSGATGPLPISGLATDGDAGWRVLPGEGGHMRFAPRDELGIGLLRALSVRYGSHVSAERVVSGQGLVDAYDHVRGDVPRWPEMDGEDPAAVVSRRALADTCPASRAALAVFVDTYADVAADLVLSLNAGAVWLLGGITSRILPLLRPRFRSAFEDKGRLRGLLEQVPVRVVTHADPGLLGARMVAEARLAGRTRPTAPPA